MKIKPIKVSVLNQFIKKYLTSNPILNTLRVEGEISNIRMSKTGYTYFTLGDEESVISCVCFYAKNAANGDKVIVEGEISLYEKRGTYQINVKNIEHIGQGKILKDLEILKDKLKREGFFEKKKKLPLYPSRIGVITSKSGAAIKDILKTFESVRGNFEILIYDSLVQGEESKIHIINGLKYFNEQKVSVILISRGGGSFEDINIFNNTEIAEAIFKSNIPVVTGIGHETDRTLCDYVADEYCHTPTAAATRIVKGYQDVLVTLENTMYKLRSSVYSSLKLKTSDIKSYKYILKSYFPVENIYKQKNILENFKKNVEQKLNGKLKENYFKLQILKEKLENNNYNKQFKKGYAMIFDKNGNLIRHKNQINEKDIINIKFNDFSLDASIMDIKDNK